MTMTMTMIFMSMLDIESFTVHQIDARRIRLDFLQ